MTRLSVILSACIVLVACSGEQEVDYCKDHHLFHSEHLDNLGALSVVMADDGRLTSELVLPATISEAGIEEQLRDSSTIYTLQTARDCAAATSNVGRREGNLVATYESQCGLDNKIGQLDVVLFDNLPSLDELEVDVVTPVTQKHFAISRQCESAIFRLN